MKSVTARYLIITGIFIFSFTSSQAQSVRWVNTISSNVNGTHFQGTACADISGNVYVLGEVIDSVFIGKRAFGAPEKKRSCLVMVKYDSLGTLLWMKFIPGTMLPRSWQYSEFTAKRGDDGFFYLNVGTDSIYGGDYEYIVYGNNAVQRGSLLLKLDTSGNLLWRKKTDAFGRMALDAQNNIYLTGSFYDTCCFASGYCFNIPGGPYMYLSRFDSSGSFLKARIEGLNINDWRMAASPSGKIYAAYNTDFFRSPEWADTAKFHISGKGESFVACFDRSGHTLWTTAVPAHAPNGVETDKDGFLYLFGSSDSTGNLNGATVGIKNDNSNYLVKLDSNGKVVWARNTSTWCETGKPCGTIVVTAEASVTDPDGTTWAIGFSKRKGVKIGNIKLPTNGAFVVAYNKDGEVLNAASLFTKEVIYGICKGGNPVYAFANFDKMTIGKNNYKSRRKNGYDFFVARIY